VQSTERISLFRDIPRVDGAENANGVAIKHRVQPAALDPQKRFELAKRKLALAVETNTGGLTGILPCPVCGCFVQTVWDWNSDVHASKKCITAGDDPATRIFAID
jgi:hypothetical protein